MKTELSQPEVAVDSIERIKMKEKISYGIGNLGLQLILTTALSFITYFYTEVVGIAAATVGTLLLIARIFDGLTDLFMGRIVDKTKSKHGKARPWLLWLAVPSGISIILLFSAPEFGETGKIVYALITYTITLAFVYTAISVPYNTMISTITKNQLDRGHLVISKTSVNAIVAVAIGAVTLPIVSLYGGGKQGWILMAATYSVLIIASLLITFKNTKERSIESFPKENQVVNDVPLKESIKALFKNKYWFIILGVSFTLLVIVGTAGVNVFYADYILGDKNLVGLIGLALAIPQFIVLIFMGILLKKFTKRSLTLAGFILVFLGACINIINPESLTIVLISKFVAGLGLAPAVIAVVAMIADTVDYGEWKTGVRNEGLLFAAESFSQKVGTGVGAMLLGLALGIGGYVSGQATQPPEAILAIKFVFIYLPMICVLIVIFLLSFYKLDKLYPTIIEELAQRKKNEE